jgi:prephenate dehydratase
MAEKIRRVQYFYLEVEDRPGEGARVLGKLKDGGVNLLSFTAFPTASGKAQLTVVPERPDAFLATAKSAGLTHGARKECFLVQGEDRVGAVYDVLKRLAESKINCVASNGGSAPGGGYSLVVFVRPGDLAAAARALGV